jgi:hypothetical protein
MSGSSMVFSANNGHDTGPAGPGIRVLICTWVSDSATGAATGTTTDQWVGELVKIVTVPATSASGLEPTNDYSVTITEATTGASVLLGCDQTLTSNQLQAPSGGAQVTYPTLVSADSTPVAVGLRPVICDRLTVAIASAGDSKAGVVYLFFKTFK